MDLVLNDNILIELKTINTNYRVKNTKNKIRLITKNIDDLLKDIEKLKRIENKSIREFVIFLVFPLENNKKWSFIHYEKIKKELKYIKFKEFKFKNDIPGIVFIGEI